MTTIFDDIKNKRQNELSDARNKEVATLRESICSKMGSQAFNAATISYQSDRKATIRIEGHYPICVSMMTVRGRIHFLDFTVCKRPNAILFNGCVYSGSNFADALIAAELPKKK